MRSCKMEHHHFVSGAARRRHTHAGLEAQLLEDRVRLLTICLEVGKEILPTTTRTTRTTEVVINSAPIIRNIVDNFGQACGTQKTATKD